MSFKGFLRKVSAAERANQRAREKRARQHQVHQKLQQKAQQLEDARAEVEDYELRVQELKSLHLDATEVIDWQGIATASAPAPPKQVWPKKTAAEALLANYQPRWWERLFGLAAGRRRGLQAEVLRAEVSDQQDFTSAHSLYQEQLNECRLQQQLAHALLGGDPQAQLDVLAEFDGLQQLSDVAQHFRLNPISAHTVEMEIDCFGLEYLPEQSCSLLQSGKLSRKDLPKGERLALHQDYVCSAVLRVGLEVLAAVPAEFAVVHARCLMLNDATGHQEWMIVVSVALARSTLGRLNLTSIDPSSAMGNFSHAMNFSKIKGFKPVDALPAAQFG